MGDVEKVIVACLAFIVAIVIVVAVGATLKTSQETEQMKTCVQSGGSWVLNRDKPGYAYECRR